MFYGGCFMESLAVHPHSIYDWKIIPAWEGDRLLPRHRLTYLPLLPSGPDGVHKCLSHGVAVPS